MKRTNILIAISNIVKDPIVNLMSHYRSSNRINNVGEALEFYIKDVFCSSLNIQELDKKFKIYSDYFSYNGNQNNPPDLIIKNGDAFEIKKVEGPRAGLALNSSYPKDKLYTDDPMITAACRNCEDWKEKEVFYVAGVAKDNILKSIWFVHGSCYAADRETYEKIKKKIKTGIDEMPGIEFSETNELGRVNKVDPLGITYLRIRGMWGIENPSRVFSYLSPAKAGENFVMNALILKDKYMKYPKEDRLQLEALKETRLSIREVDIMSPNNSANLLKAILISFVGKK